MSGKYVEKFMANVKGECSLNDMIIKGRRKTRQYYEKKQINENILT